MVTALTIANPVIPWIWNRHNVDALEPVAEEIRGLGRRVIVVLSDMLTRDRVITPGEKTVAELPPSVAGALWLFIQFASFSAHPGRANRAIRDLVRLARSSLSEIPDAKVRITNPKIFGVCAHLSSGTIGIRKF